MTADDFRQRRAQSGDVQVTSETHGERNIISRRAWIELMDEPQPLLRIGKSQCSVSGDARWSRRLQSIARAELGIDVFCQTFNCRRFKQSVYRHFNLKVFAHA